LGLDDREDCLDFASVRNQGYEFSQSKNSTHLFQPPSMAAFCRITATYTLEQYRKRRLLHRENIDCLTFTGEHIFALRKYPVRRILSVHAAKAFFDFFLGGGGLQGKPLFGPETWLTPKHYFCLPKPSTDAEDGGSPLDGGTHEDIPFSLVLRPPIRLYMEEMSIKVRYRAGYGYGMVSADMASTWRHGT
jgi:hypothetical protein